MRSLRVLESAAALAMLPCLEPRAAVEPSFKRPTRDRSSVTQMICVTDVQSSNSRHDALGIMLILQLTQLLTRMQYFLGTDCYSRFTHATPCMTKQGAHM